MKSLENIVSLLLCVVIACGSAWLGYKVGHFVGYLQGKASRLIPGPKDGDPEVQIPSPIGNPANVL